MVERTGLFDRSDYTSPGRRPRSIHGNVTFPASTHRPHTDIPPHRWRQFLSNCNNFLTGATNEGGSPGDLLEG
jgi:hypothetical protein